MSPVGRIPLQIFSIQLSSNPRLLPRIERDFVFTSRSVYSIRHSSVLKCYALAVWHYNILMDRKIPKYIIGNNCLQIKTEFMQIYFNPIFFVDGPWHFVVIILCMFYRIIIFLKVYDISKCLRPTYMLLYYKCEISFLLTKKPMDWFQ